MKQIERYSIGVGDRFGHAAPAQLAAMKKLLQDGALAVPVWNKSNREHTLIGTEPADVRSRADAAVKAGGWKHGYYVDADHISQKTVGRFFTACDFFTLDVADEVGSPAAPHVVDAFVARHRSLVGNLALPNVTERITVNAGAIREAAGKYLLAAAAAGAIYRRVAAEKGEGAFITEVSADETDRPLTPVELLVFLAALADERVPAQTIAPKFTGRFNKGVDYVGDVTAFAREFDLDLGVIAYAVREFGLPENLKLSVHSGSDKFKLYPVIGRLIRRHQAGLHLKTAGTTWLEEVAGLADAEGEGAAIAKEVYGQALARFDEVCAPYASVIEIDRRQLPSAPTVKAWLGAQFARALTHDQSCAEFNPHLRQLVHVSFKIAAEMGPRFHGALDANRDSIAARISGNLYHRHLKPLFLE
jgi:tagaturonate epimerase